MCVFFFLCVFLFSHEVYKFINLKHLLSVYSNLNAALKVEPSELSATASSATCLFDDGSRK